MQQACDLGWSMPVRWTLKITLENLLAPYAAGLRPGLEYAGPLDLKNYAGEPLSK
jgi:hypothetical protein